MRDAITFARPARVAEIGKESAHAVRDHNAVRGPAVDRRPAPSVMQEPKTRPGARPSIRPETRKAGRQEAAESSLHVQGGTAQAPGVQRSHDRAAPDATTIHVTIGRVEVRATPGQPARPTVSKPAQPSLSLEAYLRQRDGAQ